MDDELFAEMVAHVDENEAAYVAMGEAGRTDE